MSPQINQTASGPDEFNPIAFVGQGITNAINAQPYQNVIEANSYSSQPSSTPPAQFLGVEDFSVRDNNERSLKMIDSQGNLDKQVISRIKDMKAEYEKQINDYIKDKAVDNIKIETLAKRIQDNE